MLTKTLLLLWLLLIKYTTLDCPLAYHVKLLMLETLGNIKKGMVTHKQKLVP